MEIILARNTRLYRVSLKPMYDGRSVVTTRFGKSLAMACGGYHHHFTGDTDVAFRKACALVHAKLRDGFRLDTGDLSEWPAPEQTAHGARRTVAARRAGIVAQRLATLVPTTTAVLL